MKNEVYQNQLHILETRNLPSLSREFKQAQGEYLRYCNQFKNKPTLDNYESLVDAMKIYSSVHAEFKACKDKIKKLRKNHIPKPKKG